MVQMNPPISIICCTYGRPERLEEMLYSLLIQDYKGVMERIILNDREDQKLTCLSHGIINTEIRFPDLGTKRAYANSLASFDIVTTVDDDDIIMPWHISEMVKGLQGVVQDGLGFYLPSHYFFVKGSTSLECSLKGKGPAGVPIYTKALYEKAGGYPAWNSGQDQKLLGRMRAVWKEPKDQPIIKPSYLYRWADGGHHFSGNTDGNEYIRAKEKRDAITGKIELKPRWKHDYHAVIKNSLEEWETKISQ